MILSTCRKEGLVAVCEQKFAKSRKMSGDNCSMPHTAKIRLAKAALQKEVPASPASPPHLPIGRVQGRTTNFCLVLNVPREVPTVTKPVVAPLGTTVVRKLSDLMVNCADTTLNATMVALVNPCPRMP